MATAPGARSLRNIETRKKKASRTIPRTPATPFSGNTLGARQRSKKAAGLRRVQKVKAAATPGA